jgi:transporter family-2 protein
MSLLLVVTALVIGVALPLQAGINAELRTWLGHPLQAALVSFAVGTTALFVLVVSLGLSWSGVSSVGRAPWWVWFGGLLGATYVSLTVVLAPRLGAATMIGAVMAGQLIGSLLMDHYGIVGYSVRSISIERLLGAALLVAGVMLIQRG